MRMSRSFIAFLSVFSAGLVLGGVGMGLAATIRGSSIFTDVPEGAFFDEAVGEMYSLGVIKGYSNGMFGPNDFVTRGQVAVMMQRFRDDILSSGAAQSSSTQSSSTSSSSSSSSVSSSASSSSSSSYSHVYNGYGTFQFTSSKFSIPESVPSMSILVERTDGTEGAATVKYSIKAGTATADTDFTAVASSTLSFADGVKSKTITVSLKDDVLAEGAETIILELSTPTGGAQLGSPATATFTILDNEASNNTSSSSSSTTSSTSSQSSGAGTLGFSAAGYEARENSAAITITVVRTGGSTGQVGVTYATSDKTARSGSEYTSTNGTLTFASGEISKTFSVPLIDDTTVDGKKNLALTLSAPTGGAALGTSSVLLAIADDEIGTYGSGSFMFSKSSFSAVEDDGVATITVNRLGGTLHTVSVTYTTSNGSASPGLDYTHTTGTLTFEPGEQSKTFTVPIVSDSVNDSNEYFTVTLSSPTLGSTIDTPSTVPVYLYD